MSRLRYKTKKEFLQISNVSSLLVSSLRMGEPCLTTTSRKSQLSTLFSVCEEECRFLSKP